MIILSKYDMNQISQQLFYIRSKEYVSCPCCGDQLQVIGSRKRKYINKLGEEVTLIIRRLRCKKCKRVHHELPDILIPYKHHESISIENVLSETDNSDAPVEESTIYRWKRWFGQLSKKKTSILPSDKMRYSVQNSISMFVITSYPKWLARIVRRLVNLNLW